MIRRTRPVSWIRAALKEFETFPEGAKSNCLAALTIAAEGGKPDIAKPMYGLGSGIFEIALKFRGGAFRAFMHYRSTMTFGSSTHSRRNRRKALRHPSTRST